MLAYSPGLHTLHIVPMFFVCSWALAFGPAVFESGGISALTMSCTETVVTVSRSPHHMHAAHNQIEIHGRFMECIRRGTSRGVASESLW